MPKITMTPGNHLRALRTRALLSQQQLARTSGCSLRSLSRAENDQPISEMNKERLGWALHVDPKDIWPPVLRSAEEAPGVALG